MPLDKVQLDSMVQGLEDDVASWEELLSDPNREDAWKTAVKRREQLDLFCAFVCRWPLLAKSMRGLKKLMKSSGSSPLLTLKGNYSDDVFIATLKPGSEETPKSIDADMIWGEQVIAEVEDQASILFDAGQHLKIHYQYGDSSGWITSDDSWVVENDDGAVILTVLDTESNCQGSLSYEITRSKSVGCVILMPI